MPLTNLKEIAAGDNSSATVCLPDLECGEFFCIRVVLVKGIVVQHKSQSRQLR